MANKRAGNCSGKKKKKTESRLEEEQSEGSWLSDHRQEESDGAVWRCEGKHAERLLCWRTPTMMSSALARTQRRIKYMMQNIDVWELALKCALKSTTKSPQGAFSAKSAGRFDGQVGEDQAVYKEIFYLGKSNICDQQTVSLFCWIRLYL